MRIKEAPENAACDTVAVSAVTLQMKKLRSYKKAVVLEGQQENQSGSRWLFGEQVK